MRDPHNGIRRRTRHGAALMAGNVAQLQAGSFADQS